MATASPTTPRRLQQAIDRGAGDERRGDRVCSRGPLPPVRDPQRLAGDSPHRVRRGAGRCWCWQTTRRGTRTPSTRSSWSFSPGAAPTAASRRTRTRAPSTPRSATSTSRSATATRARWACGRTTRSTASSRTWISASAPAWRAFTRAATSSRTCISTAAEYGIWTRHAVAGLAVHPGRRHVRGAARGRHPRAAAGLTLIRPQFRNVPTAIEIEPGSPDELWVKDARFENISGSGGDRQPGEQRRGPRSTWRTWCAAACRRSRCSARAGGRWPRRGRSTS